MASYGRSFVDSAKGVEISTRNVSAVLVRCNSSPASLYRWCDESTDGKNDVNDVTTASDIGTNNDVHSQCVSCHATMDNSEFKTITNVVEPVLNWYDDVESECNAVCTFANDLPSYVAAIVAGDSEDSASGSSDEIHKSDQARTADNNPNCETEYERNLRLSQLFNAMVARTADGQLVLKTAVPTGVNVIMPTSQSKAIDVDETEHSHKIATIDENGSIQKSSFVGIDRVLERTGACIADPLSNVKRKFKLILSNDNDFDKPNESRKFEDCGDIDDDTLSSIIIDYNNGNDSDDLNDDIVIKNDRKVSFVLPTLNKTERLILSKSLATYNEVRVNKFACTLDTICACTLFGAAFGFYSESSICSAISLLFSAARLATRIITLLVKSTNKSESSWTATQTLISKLFENSDVKPYITNNGDVRWHVVPCREYHV